MTIFGGDTLYLVICGDLEAREQELARSVPDCIAQIWEHKDAHMVLALNGNSGTFEDVSEQIAEQMFERDPEANHKFITRNLSDSYREDYFEEQASFARDIPSLSSAQAMGRV